MAKITQLFKRPNLNEFLRIVISDSNLSLRHIRHHQIIQKIEIELIEKVKIFEYIHKFSTLPLEVIISNSTMSCRSISLNNSREKDIANLAENILSEKEHLINFVLYEKKISYRNGIALFCDLKLTPVLSQILYETLNIGNCINAIIASPFWIVSNYFKRYPTETGKFEVQIFVIKAIFGQEMIALHNGKYVYYKKITTGDFDEKLEVNSAIKLVTQLFNTSLEDVAIYSLNEDTIDTFTTKSHIDMNVVSRSDNFVSFNRKKNFIRVLNSFCLLVVSTLFIKTAIDVKEIINCNNKIESMKKIVNVLGSDVIDDIEIWEQLNSKAYLKQINFKAKFIEKMKNINKKLQNVSITFDIKTKQITFNPIYEEQ